MLFGVLLSAAVVTAPVPDMRTSWWFEKYDTPTHGLAPGELSLVVAEITVNDRGAFAGCLGHVYAGNPQMGPYVCSRLEKRAEFQPARGPQGRKIFGVYRKLIIVANVKADSTFRAPIFGIHVPGPANASDNPFEIQFFVDSNGEVSDCSLVERVGLDMDRHKQSVEPATVQRACAAVPLQLKPVPPRDKHGEPIATAQNALVQIDSSIKAKNQ